MSRKDAFATCFFVYGEKIPIRVQKNAICRPGKVEAYARWKFAEKPEKARKI